MSVDTVIPALKTIHEGITGIVRAFDTLPGKLNAADLPAVLVVPGEATQTALTPQGDLEERVYHLLLFVKPLALDTFNTAYNDARVFFRRFHEAYGAAYQLDSLANVLLARIESDSGVQPLVYGEVQYAGIEFRLRVREIYGMTIDA